MCNDSDQERRQGNTPCRSSAGPLLPSLILALSLMGCGTSSPFYNAGTTQYTPVPAGHEWASPPGRTMALERLVDGEREQRIGLANQTSVIGDNELLLRSYPRGYAPNRLRFEELRNRIGGFPPPFAAAKTRDFTASSDALGTYLWTKEDYGTSMTCVLAMRHLDTGARLIPSGENTFDAVLRNCVWGNTDTALAPIRADSMGFSGTAAISAQQDGSRMLSPLAGPLPR